MKITSTNEPNRVVNELHDGYVINHHEIDKLIGRVLTQIETLGLQEKQEQSIKDVLKQTIRGSIGEHQNSFIDGGLMHSVQNLNQKLHEECIKNPPEEVAGSSPRDGVYEITFTSTN